MKTNNNMLTSKKSIRRISLIIYLVLLWGFITGSMGLTDDCTRLWIINLMRFFKGFAYFLAWILVGGIGWLIGFFGGSDHKYEKDSLPFLNVYSYSPIIVLIWALAVNMMNTPDRFSQASIETMCVRVEKITPKPQSIQVSYLTNKTIYPTFINALGHNLDKIQKGDTILVEGVVYCNMAEVRIKTLKPKNHEIQKCIEGQKGFN